MIKNALIFLAVISTVACATTGNNAGKGPRKPAQSSSPICLPTGDLCSEANHQMVVDAAAGAQTRIDAFKNLYGSDLTKVPAHPQVIKAIGEFASASKESKSMYLRWAVDQAIDACQVNTSTEMAEFLQEKAVQEGMNCGGGDMAMLALTQTELNDMRLNYCYRSMVAVAALDTQTPGMKNVPMIASYPEGKRPGVLDAECKKQYDEDMADGAHEAPIYYAGCMSSWRSDYMSTIIGQLRKFRKAIPADAAP